LKGKLPANHSFKGEGRLVLFQIGPLSRVEETYVSLKRKPSLLETGAPGTLFPCEN
jgi:hypothetical protein